MTLEELTQLVRARGLKLALVVDAKGAIQCAINANEPLDRDIVQMVAAIREQLDAVLPRYTTPEKS